MSNKKQNFSAKGYYIALVLCAVAIGVSGYLYYRGSEAETAQTSVAATQQADVPAAATKPGVVQPMTEATEPVPATTTPKKALKTAAPLEGAMPLLCQ